jgi:hypothetical protein
MIETVFARLWKTNLHENMNELNGSKINENNKHFKIKI